MHTFPIFQSQEFVLQSPNYPFPYPPNLDCVAVVFPADENICSLELRFDEFKIEASEVLDECANDYLEVSDVNSAGQSMRYCGAFTGIRLLELGPRGKRFRCVHRSSNKVDILTSILGVQRPECCRTFSGRVKVNIVRERENEGKKGLLSAQCSRYKYL